FDSREAVQVGCSNADGRSVYPIDVRRCAYTPACLSGSTRFARRDRALPCLKHSGGGGARFRGNSDLRNSLDSAPAGKARAWPVDVPSVERIEEANQGQNVPPAIEFGQPWQRSTPEERRRRRRRPYRQPGWIYRGDQVTQVHMRNVS